MDVEGEEKEEGVLKEDAEKEEEVEKLLGLYHLSGVRLQMRERIPEKEKKQSERGGVREEK